MVRFVMLLAAFIMLACAPFSYAKRVYTLEQAVNEAISNNYLIKAAIESRKAAIEGLKSAKANMLPVVKFSYNYTRLKDYPYSIMGGGYKIKMGHRNNVKWDLTIAEPIFTGYALTIQKELAALGVDISDVQQKQAVLDVAENVKMAYFNILLAKKALMVAEQNVKALGSHVRDAEKFYKAGLIPYNDLLKSRVALAAAKQKEVAARNNLRLAISAFNIALGKKIEADTDVVDVGVFKPVHYSLERLFSIALRKRPEIEALRLQLKSAFLGARLAKSSYYPQISLFATYQQSGKDLLANNNDFTNNHNAMVGININWEIFHFGKSYHDVESQYHKAFALREKIKSIEDNIKLDVKKAYLDLNTAIRNIKTAEVALKQAKENYRITNLRYKQQMTTSTEVLDARTYLTQAQTNYYSALYGYYMALARLKRALGER